jgi:hypothetical protein
MCPNCQAPTRDDEDFCTNCGTPLRREGPAGQQSPGSYPPPAQASGQQPPTWVAGQPGPGGQQQQPWGAQPGQPPPYAQQPGQPPTYGQPPTQPPPPYAQQPTQPPPFGQQPSAHPQFGGQPAPGWQGQVQRPSTPAFQLDFKRLGQTDLIIGGATIVMFISLFLPWYGYLGATEDGLTAHGFLAISLIVALALIAYLVLRAGWDALPFRLPIAHAPLLLVGTGVQLFFVLIAFLLKPYSILSWQIGAFLALIAAAVACGVIAVPAIRSLQGR